MGAPQRFYDMHYYSVSSHSLPLKSYIAPHLIIPVSRTRSTACCLAADFAEGLDLGRKWVETQTSDHNVQPSCDACASIFRLLWLRADIMKEQPFSATHLPLQNISGVMVI